MTSRAFGTVRARLHGNFSACECTRGRKPVTVLTSTIAGDGANLSPSPPFSSTPHAPTAFQATAIFAASSRPNCRSCLRSSLSTKSAFLITAASCSRYFARLGWGTDDCVCVCGGGEDGTGLVASAASFLGLPFLPPALIPLDFVFPVFGVDRGEDRAGSA